MVCMGEGLGAAEMFWKDAGTGATCAEGWN